MEEDGYFVSDSKHWELIENKPVFIYDKGIKGGQCYLNIPIDVVRHLKLNHKDKVDIAIRRHKKD
jgi:hypothetical protein